MGSKSKVESEVITKGIWVFSPEEIARIKNFKDSEKDTEWLTHDLTTDRWTIQLELTKNKAESDKVNFGVFLTALVQDADYLNGTSRLAWSRGAGTIRVCDLISPAESLSVVESIEDVIEEDQFDSISSSVGWPAFTTVSEVVSVIEKYNSLAIRFEFVAPEPQSGQKGAEKTALMYFDQLKHSDLAFRFAGTDTEPRFLFALKSVLTANCSYYRTLFASGFAETTNSNSIDLTKLSASSALKRNITFDTSELRPFYTPTRSNSQSSPASPRHLDQSSKDHEVETDAARSSKRKRSNTDEAEVASSTLPIIDITETDFTTYRAMLAYFHTSLVPFTALPSDYLVARQAALCEHDPNEAEPFDYEDPEIWLSDDFHNLVGQKNWHGIRPCSPHSMFRLADCYGIKELRELAKSRILRSLTVENVAYELFSPLSFDYNEIQEAVLEYFNDRWAEVKSTKALETVLEKFAAGDLPEALDLVKKVWLAMEPVKKSGDAVEEKK